MRTKRLRGMVLAAGLGTRLLPITERTPKPLVEILGQPIIFHVLAHMLRARVEQIVINTHHLAPQIRAAVGDRFHGIPVHFLHEDSLRNTGGSLKYARDLLQGDGDADVLLLNGDSLIDLDVDLFIAQHRESEALATLMLKTVDNPERYGVIGTDHENRVRTLVNHVSYSGPSLKKRMFCGAHLLAPEAFREFPSDEIFGIIDKFYAPLVKADRRIIGLEQEGYFCDVGNPSDYFGANMSLLNNPSLLKNGLGLKPQDRNGWLQQNVQIAHDATVIAPVVIENGALVESHAVVGPNAIIGKNARIGAGAFVKDAVVFSNGSVESGETCQNVIIAPNCRIDLGSFFSSR